MNNCPNCSSTYETGDEVCRICGCILPLSAAVIPAGKILQTRYEIQDLVHSGGMGYVYLATDKRLYDRLCIVKQIKEPIKSEPHRKKLEEEALRMARLNHPNVAMILDHFIDGGYYFLVVERIYGKTLSEIFKEHRGHLTENEVVSWAISICDVVSYLHKEGVVHRDISPDNIMLTGEGSIKFIDFGTLRELRYVVPGGTAGMGKYGYTPPEQWQGKPEFRSDIFALGATIYYLLTGFLPLSREYLTRQTPQKDDFNPSFPPVRTKNPGVSPQLEAVLQKALRLDVNDRYSSVEELREALKNLAQVEVKKVPVLSLETRHLGFANVKSGATVTKSIILKNTGTGKLTGKLTTTQPWLKASPGNINLKSGKWVGKVSVDTRRLHPGFYGAGEINIATNGGQAKVAVDLSVIEGVKFKYCPNPNCKRESLFWDQEVRLWRCSQCRNVYTIHEISKYRQNKQSRQPSNRISFDAPLWLVNILESRRFWSLLICLGISWWCWNGIQYSGNNLGQAIGIVLTILALYVVKLLLRKYLGNYYALARRHEISPFFHRTRKSPLLRLLVILVTIALLATTIWSIYSFISNLVQNASLIYLLNMLVIVAAQLWFLNWLFKTLKHSRYISHKPKFAVVFCSLIAITIIGAFVGIEPLASYKDIALNYAVKAVRFPPETATPPPEITTPSLTLPPDTTFPVISQLNVAEYTGETATIIWETDEDAIGQIEYGITSAYGKLAATDGDLTTSHIVELTGLQPNTAYHFRVKSTDKSGNEIVSGDNKFNSGVSQKDWAEYVNEKYGFSLQYPSDWLAGPDLVRTSYHLAAFQTWENAAGYVPGITIAAFEADAPISKEWIVESFKKTDNTNPKVVSPLTETTLADGTKATTCEATYLSASAYEVRSFNICADNGGKRIRLAVFTVEEFEPYDEPLFSQVAHTLRFTPPPAPQLTPATERPAEQLPPTELSFKAKTYTNDKYGFSIQYPSDWVDRPEPVTTPYDLAAFGIPAFVPGVVINLFDADADVPMSSDWIVESFEKLRNSSPKVISPLTETTLADGTKATTYKVKFISVTNYEITAYCLDADKSGKRIRVMPWTVEAFEPYDEKLFSEIAHTLRFTA